MNTKFEHKALTQPGTIHDRPVCHCHQVSESEIRSVIEQDCVDTVESVGLRTGAGTGCGACQCKIQRLINGLPIDCGPCGFCDGCGTIRKLCSCAADRGTNLYG